MSSSLTYELVLWHEITLDGVWLALLRYLFWNLDDFSNSKVECCFITFAPVLRRRNQREWYALIFQNNMWVIFMWEKTIELIELTARLFQYSFVRQLYIHYFLSKRVFVEFRKIFIASECWKLFSEYHRPVSREFANTDNCSASHNIIWNTGTVVHRCVIIFNFFGS